MKLGNRKRYSNELEILLQWNLPWHSSAFFDFPLNRVHRESVGALQKVENERRNGFAFREAGPKDARHIQWTLTTTTQRGVAMAKSKIPQNSDRHGTDRRTFLLALPPAVGSLGLPRGTTQEEQEFQKLLIQGVQEVLDTNRRWAFQIAITVCSFAESAVKAKLIPLASRLYPDGCHTCHEKIERPHPRELYRCQECGERSERSRQLKKKIPKDHPREIPMHNALYRWKNERSTDNITVRIRDENGPVEEATKAEMKKLGIWPWWRGGNHG